MENIENRKTEVKKIEAVVHELPGRPPFMLDRDLAKTYGVETRELNQARDRNPEKFDPGVDWFELSRDEVTESDSLRESIKFGPSTFTAYTKRGAYMFVTILNTKQAIAQAINVVDGFNNYVHLVEQVRAGNIRLTPEPRPNAVIDALTSELLAGRPEWSSIIRYKKLCLNNVETGKLIGRSSATVRKILRRMEACGLIKPPANLLRMQIGVSSMLCRN